MIIRENQLPRELDQILGMSPAFLDTLKIIPRIAKSEVCVLITGETGTGKELVAKAVHQLSYRRGKPFVPINCGALPLELIENELFGHKKGAYTGADDNVTGIIQEADGGTLFLDEIDSLPIAAQSKLLRFMEYHELRALGNGGVEKVDTRIVAASNADFAKLIDEGKFRQDFFFRLGVTSIQLPPLRERIGDVKLLAQYFLHAFESASSIKIHGFENNALRVLEAYDWPGNIRELEHVIHRAVILCDKDSIAPEHLNLPSGPKSNGKHFQEEKKNVIDKFERRYLREIIAAHKGNISAAARAAGKDRKSFWELLKKHSIFPDR